MDDHARQAEPVQQSLFPDACEIQAASLAALRDLDVPKARRLLERARGQNPRLVNLGVIDQALGVLESVLGRGGPPDPGRLAAVVVATRDRFLAGYLHRAAAEFTDQIIARYWRRHYRHRSPSGGFLDEGRQVHRGVLDLVLGHPATARHHLRTSLDGGLQHRGDLWAWLGDACLALERRDEANACYVRGLLLAAGDVDLLRIRLPRLARLHQELCGAHPQSCARELLLVHAWLESTLQIPPGNGWLDGQVSRLHARARPDSAPEDRYRRFALLLYLDRSRPPRQIDLAQREEMARLEAGLFERYMYECRRRERADTSPGQA